MIIAKVPVAYLDEVKRKLDESDARYRQKEAERKLKAAQKGQGDGEEEEEVLEKGDDEYDDL